MGSLKFGNENIRRQYNFYRVLRSIWTDGGVSRKDLCEKLNLDKATMSTIVSQLIRIDLVEEYTLSKNAERPGRKPIGLQIKKDFGCTAGFEIRINGIKAVVKDMQFNTVETFFFPSKRLRAESLKKSFFASLDKVKTSLKDCPLIGIGVAVPGIVDHRKGLLIESWELGINNEPFDFQAEIFDDLDIPGFLENDANCCAWGIMAKNRDKSCDNFMYSLFTYDPVDKYYSPEDTLGMGLAFVIDGKIYRGPDNTAGEFQSIDNSGSEVNQFDLTVVEQAVYRVNATVQEKLFAVFSDHLALLINFFNFKKVILGGDLPDLILDLEGIIQESIDRNWPYGHNFSCDIQIQREVDPIISSGAAGMFLEKLYTVPELDHLHGALLWRNVFENLGLPV